MKKYRLKQSVKNAMILTMFYSIIVIGIVSIGLRNQQLDKKMTDMSGTQISQKN